MMLPLCYFKTASHVMLLRCLSGVGVCRAACVEEIQLPVFHQCSHFIHLSSPKLDLQRVPTVIGDKRELDKAETCSLSCNIMDMQIK